MSRAPLYALSGALALLGVAVLAGPWQHRAGAESRAGNVPATHPVVEPYLDPKLRLLLRQTARGDEYGDSPFAAALSAIARQQGWDPGRPGHRTEEGRAVAVRDGHARYTIVILGMSAKTIPGRDYQQLLLLDRDGRLLDRLSCSISNRLLWGKAAFRTDTPGAGEEDGAQFVIRYLPGRGGAIVGNFSHGIAHAGEERFFCWDQEKPDSVRSAEWVRQGLCRVVVRHGKFAVLFPPLEK